MLSSYHSTIVVDTSLSFSDSYSPTQISLILATGIFIFHAILAILAHINAITSKLVVVGTALVVIASLRVITGPI
jgi:ABC-type cobalamin transport system permease subunit